MQRSSAKLVLGAIPDSRLLGRLSPRRWRRRLWGRSRFWRHASPIPPRFVSRLHVLVAHGFRLRRCGGVLEIVLGQLLIVLATAHQPKQRDHSGSYESGARQVFHDRVHSPWLPEFMVSRTRTTPDRQPGSIEYRKTRGQVNREEGRPGTTRVRGSSSSR